MIDIRQGEVTEVLPDEEEEKAEGSEDSTQAGNIERPSDDTQGADVADVVRSIVFTTESTGEIKATTTEKVAPIKSICVVQLISLN